MLNHDNPQPCLIVMRMRGHAGASGYDRLAEFIDGQMIHAIHVPSLVERVVGRSLRFMIRRSGSQWYHRSSLLSELHAAGRWCRSRGRVFHFLYGENCYRYLGELKSKSRRNAIVCTYHVPPAKFCTVVKDRAHLRKVDAVLVVSTTQIDFFADIVGAQRVFYVPHGIDVGYFRPAEDKTETAETIRLVFVGSHLRDHATLGDAARLLNDQGVAFSLNVVTPSRYHDYFRGIANVAVHSGISDADLLEFYRKAQVLVMPLLDCTANNSLLEGMACGLPIICTDVPGAHDYVDERFTVFTPPQDASAIADAVVQLQTDVALRSQMAGASRQRALDFSWPKIARRTLSVYCEAIAANNL